MKKIFLIALVLLFAVAAYLFLAKPQFEISIKKEQIQSLIEKEFPYEKTNLLFVKTVLSNPQIHLEKGNDHIGFSCDISVFLSGVEKLKSEVYAETKIVYDAESQTVSFSDTRLRKLRIQGLPPEAGKVVRETVGKVIPELLDSRPIYRLNSEKTEERIAGALLKNIKVENGFLKIIFGP